MLYFEKYNSPIGMITVSCDEKYLVGIQFGSSCAKENPNEITNKTVLQLKEYFCGKRKSFDLPIFLDGTDYQVKVWKELMNIPYGKVCTYGFIAKRIGIPKGAQAVGGANKRNPLPIVIPCHRVVAHNGIGGYTPGLEIKKFLLRLEKNNSGSD